MNRNKKNKWGFTPEGLKFRKETEVPVIVEMKNEALINKLRSPAKHYREMRIGETRRYDAMSARYGDGGATAAGDNKLFIHKNRA